MKSLKNFILILTIIFILESVIGYFAHVWYVNTVIENEIYERIEEKSAQAIASFWLSLKDINLLIDDWADWDLMAEAVQNWNNKFANENFPESLIEDNNLFYLAVIDNNMRNIYVLESKKINNFNYKNLNMRIKELIRNKKSKIVQSIINLSSKSFYIYAQPIEFQSIKSENRGYLVGVREIDNSLKNSISQIIQNDNLDIISIKEMNFKNLDSLTRQCFVENVEKSTYYIYSLINGDRLDESIVIKTKVNLNILKHINNLNLYFLMMALFSFSLVLYIFSMAYRSYRKKLKTILKVSGKLSKRLTNEFKENKSEDILTELEQILNTLFLNIDKLEIKRDKRTQREITKEKVFAVGRIAAELSHEINTPIRIIKNCLPTLEKKIKSEKLDTMDFKMFEMVKKEVDNIERTTRNLLSYLRNDNLKMQLINYNQIINNAIERFKKSKSINFEIKFNTENEIFLHGVSEQLDRVFINLFNNAFEAGASKIVIETQVSEEYCKLIIKDNGKGIPNEIKDTLFEPFVTIKQKRGLGLGLNISYNIISNLGGDFYLDDCEDFATCFVIKLPYVKSKSKGVNSE